MLTRDQMISKLMCHLASYKKSKSLSSRESIVTRLKLKEIDRRTPSGIVCSLI